MPNITLSLDDQVIKKVRKIAIEKDTTLTAMVRDYLERLAARDDLQKEKALAALQRSFCQQSRNMGERSWRRDDLYD